jgi:hypothetical protein
MLRAIVRLHAASRPFPIFSAAAPLAPADPMLPGLFFCLPPPPRGPRTDCGPRKRYISATAGMGRSGCSTLRGPQGGRFDDQRGSRDGGRRIPDGGSQSPHLDRRVPCRACGFRRLQPNRPIATCVRDGLGEDLSDARPPILWCRSFRLGDPQYGAPGARGPGGRHPMEPVTQAP